MPGPTPLSNASTARVLHSKMSLKYEILSSVVISLMELIRL